MLGGVEHRNSKKSVTEPRGELSENNFTALKLECKRTLSSVGGGDFLARFRDQAHFAKKAGGRTNTRAIPKVKKIGDMCET